MQPTCARCGTTELTFVQAAATRWRVVLGRLLCASCASGFAAWMRCTF
ncbi:hypothetical protein [Kitasatospora sp. NPDC088134]